MSIVLEAALIGILVGVVIGSPGGGGGITAMPVFVHVLGQAPHGAAVSSLVSPQPFMVGLTGLQAFATVLMASSAIAGLRRARRAREGQGARPGHE